MSDPPDELDSSSEQIDNEQIVESVRLRLVQLAREGLASGPDIPVDDAYWERMKAELRQRHTK